MDINQLPEKFKGTALFLGGEPAWKKMDALELITYFEEKGCVVLDVEVWEPAGKVPKVLGWSRYEIKFEGDWTLFVKLNANEARSVIEGYREVSNTVYQLEGLTQDEYQELTGKKKSYE